MKLQDLITVKEILLLLGLILIGILGRYLLVGFGLQPFPNFEIIMVLTFIAAVYIRPTLAFLVPLASMIGSDLIIGNPIFTGSQMNQIVLFTYSGFAFIAVINILKRKQLKNAFGKLQVKTIGIAAGLGVGMVLLYDIWTNLGWWYLIYPHNVQTLTAVFTAGAPFMVYHALSGAITFVVIGIPAILLLSHKHLVDIPHSQNIRHTIPALIAVICLIVLAFSGSAVQVPQKTEMWLEHADATSVTIIIQGDTWRVTDNIVSVHGDTAYTLLEACCKRNNIQVKSTYYAEFDSKLVDGIHTCTNGDENRYWQYYVNDEIPMVGADAYEVHNGDKLLWSFEVISY